MKKIISLMLAFVLVFGCVFALSSCKKDDDDETPEANNTPYANADELVAAFEKYSYNVTELSIEEFIDMYNYRFEGISTVITALLADEGFEDYEDYTNMEGIMVFYFNSDSDLGACREEIEDIFDEQKAIAAENGLSVESGTSGNIAWFGTVNAVKVACGKGGPVTPDDGGSDDKTPEVDTPATPNPDYMAAAAALEAHEFTTNVTDDEDTIAAYNIKGLVAIVQATYATLEGSLDMITIYYFDTVENTDASREDLAPGEALIEQLYGVDVTLGQEGTVLWIGTENAIKSSAGIKVDGDDVGNDNKDDPNLPEVIPMDNYFDLYTYLGDLEYTVQRECVDYGADFSSWGMPGIQAYLLSINPESKETIEIYYFDTAENADNSYEKIYGFFEDFMEETIEDGKEFIYVIEKYENMVWIGTESTIRVAAGK